MDNVKVNLHIALPGRTMYSEQECSKNPSLNETFFLSLRTKSADRQIFKINTRKCIPASKMIHLTHEAYDYMSSDECPSWARRNEWHVMSLEQRLVSHMMNIAESYGGYIMDYKILED